MPEWIDLALMPDELSLSTALGKLTHKDRDAMIKAISDRLNVSGQPMASGLKFHGIRASMSAAGQP